MQEIADEAGINKALLHYYFRSKEKLFEKIFQDVINKISAGISKDIDSDLSVFEKLEHLIGLYIDVISENPYLPVFIINEIYRNPKRMQSLLEKGMFPSLINFFSQLMQEMNIGKMRSIHPMHLFLNIIGMVVLPFAAKPMLGPALDKNMGIDYNKILSERKRVITEFVFNALKNDSYEA